MVDMLSFVQEISGCNADSSYSRNYGIIFGFLFIVYKLDIYKYLTLTSSSILDIYEHR